MSREARATFTARSLDGPTRLDQVLRREYPRWGRRAVQTSIHSGRVKINGRKVWLASWKIKNGDRLAITNPPEDKQPPPHTFQDEWLVAEEGDLIVVNKPAGLLSEPTRASDQISLLTLACRRFGRVTLRHRLDRDTSGVLLLTRHGPEVKELNRYLDAAFKRGLVNKEYVAIVAPSENFQEKGVIRTRLDTHPMRRDMMAVVESGGKLAVTEYQTTKIFQGLRWLNLWPKTGRMHQLRVHLNELGAPILGDRLYGSRRQAQKYGVERLMLHALRITLPAHLGFPKSSYEAALPKAFLSDNFARRGR